MKINQDYKKLNCQITEIKADPSISGSVEGYASTFGNVDYTNDIIEKGAFKKSKRKGSQIKMLWQHDCDDPIGVWDTIQEDEKGLFVKGRIITTTSCGNDAYELIKAGAIDSMSIGYSATDYILDQNGTRTIKALDLYEISFVTFPANPQAVVTGVKNHITTIREFEAFLRDEGGFSAYEAKLIASAGFKQRDVVADNALLNAATKLSEQFAQIKNSIKLN